MRYRILLAVVAILLIAIFVFGGISDFKTANTRPPKTDQAALRNSDVEQESGGHKPVDRGNSQEGEREGSSEYPIPDFNDFTPSSFESTSEPQSSFRQAPSQPEGTETTSQNENSPDVSRWIPRDWHLIGGGANSFVDADYRLESDFEMVWDGSASASVSTPEAVVTPPFGGIIQIVDAQNFSGQRIKYSGFLRTESPDADQPALAALWLRADDEVGSVVAFQNTHRRFAPNNTVWSEATIIIDIPITASTVWYGAYLSGKGSAWIDDLSLESVDLAYPLTAPPTDRHGSNPAPHPENVLESPANLNFEFVIQHPDQ
jgi:hypothetical protein